MQKCIRHVIFLAKHDPNGECAEIAEKLWKTLELEISADFYKEFLPDFNDDSALVREETGKVIQNLAKEYPEKTAEILAELGKLYSELKKVNK
jgi:hypothetical protein